MGLGTTFHWFIPYSEESLEEVKHNHILLHCSTTWGFCGCFQRALKAKINQPGSIFLKEVGPFNMFSNIDGAKIDEFDLYLRSNNSMYGDKEI